MADRIRKLDERYQEYLRDESRLSGRGDTISFPETGEELVRTVRELLGQGIPITVQGSRTGIAGAAVPQGGHILSTEKLCAVGEIRREGERVLVTAEPGARLSQLAACLAAQAPGFRFPPDPTEESATLGGAFACSAKGMNACRWGDTAAYVEGAELLLADGSLVELRRGECLFDRTGCTLPGGRRLETGPLPASSPWDRGPLGLREGADLLDVLAGSEGMLGIVTRLELAALPEPAEQWGVLFFFREPEGAAAFARRAMELDGAGGLPGAGVAAAELYHREALRLAGEFKSRTSRLKAIPDFPEGAACALYLELEGEDPDAMEEALLALLEAFGDCGGEENDTWAGAGAGEMEKFRLLRHAVPEAVNAAVDEARRADPGVVKLAADFTAPFARLEETLAMYEEGIAASGITGVIFGHISQNHLHVNLLPKSREEWLRGRALLEEWAGRIAAWGGLVVSENGVGKLKRELLRAYAPPEALAAAGTLKRLLDPRGLLNPGNML